MWFSRTPLILHFPLSVFVFLYVCVSVSVPVSVRGAAGQHALYQLGANPSEGVGASMCSSMVLCDFSSPPYYFVSLLSVSVSLSVESMEMISKTS